MKKLVSLVLALLLCLSCVSALAAEAWTVTCPWAPSGVAAMVNQKAAALSTTYSNDYVIVANAEKGDTATINSWLTKYTEADPQMCFIGEGMFGITAILDPERMNFTYDDFEYVENLYSSIFVMSARKELGITSIDALKAYLEAGNQIMVGTNGATGSEAFLAAALIGAMGYGEQFYLIPYESAAEAAQAVARGEVDVAVSHQSQILETWQQGGVDVFAAFDGEAIAQGPFAGVEGVGQYGYPYFRNRCFVMARKGTDAAKAAELKELPADVFALSIPQIMPVMSALVFSVLIGLVVALIVTGIMRGKLKTVRPKYVASDYVRPGSMNVRVRRDLYLYRTVSRRPKPKSSGSGGSSGSRRSGGGGSF